LYSKFYEEHETQDFLRLSNIRIEEVPDKIFEEEEKKREVYDG